MNLPEPNEYATQHGHNPFPPRWEKWLSATRRAILSAQPQAGRHVTIDEHPGKGTVINVDDTSTRRPTGGGCSGCMLPDGDCPHTVCIDVQLDAEDDTDGDVIDFLNSGDSTNIIAVFPTVGTTGWELYGGSPETDIFISTPDPRGDGLVHHISVTLTRVDDSTVAATLTVDGTSSSANLTIDTAASTNYDQLLIGSNNRTLGTASHRTVKCASLLANPGSTEEEFNFPPDSFDSLTSGASIVAGALRVDSSSDAYGTKGFDPAYDLICAQTCTCETPPGTPIPQHVAGTITLNCDCEEFCGVSSHVEIVDDDLTGTGCSCSVSFVYDFDCSEECTPCHIVGSINVAYDYDAMQWNVTVNYGYSNSSSVVLCSFSVTLPFDFSGGGPVTIDEDVPNGLPSSSCISHISLTIT
jgi:hypothetical protein